MNRSHTKIFLFFAFTLLLSDIAHAVCTNNGGGVWTTSDNTSAAVNECITSASAGNTINVIAGSGSATWSADAITISVSKPLKIIGPGRDNLTINLGGNYPISIDPYIGTAQIPATRISGFKFVSPLEAKYTAIRARGQGWRIDHCAYESIESATQSSTALFIEPTAINTTIAPSGLIDNNIITNGKILNTGFGTFLKMSGVWAAVPSLGLGTANTVYIEDNFFNSNKTERKLFADTNYAGNYVFRYNTVNHGWVLVHGLQDDTTRGPTFWEIYGNIFSTPVDNYNGPIAALAGTGVIYNNDLTSSAHWYDLWVGFGHERSSRSIGTAGLCNGSSGWDGNLNATGWPCRDQIGTSTDASLWSSETNLPAPTQTLSPAYVWSIFEGGVLRNPIAYGAASTHIHENRDYYRHDTTNCAAGNASCMAGVGCGTLANRPANCTTGVAYWATTQSCSNLTGMVGANPTTSISGTLYKCTSTNTWTAYYTPYTYPHPLRGTNKGNKGATIINTIGGLNAIDIVGGLNVINQ